MFDQGAFQTFLKGYNIFYCYVLQPTHTPFLMFVKGEERLKKQQILRDNFGAVTISTIEQKDTGLETRKLEYICTDVHFPNRCGENILILKIISTIWRRQTFFLHTNYNRREKIKLLTLNEILMKGLEPDEIINIRKLVISYYLLQNY